jgi:hypothetical protein
MSQATAMAPHEYTAVWAKVTEHTAIEKEMG